MIGDTAVNADRREAAGLAAVRDHKAHQHRTDSVPVGKAHRNGCQDRHGAGTDGADGRQQRCDKEHHPRDYGDAPTGNLDAVMHEQIDRAVALGDREEIGDADQRDEEIAGKAREDLCRGHIDKQRAHDESGGESERAHIDRHCRGDDEHHHQAENSCDMHRHARPPAFPTGTVPQP